MVDMQAIGVDTEVVRDRHPHAERDVAQPDRAMPGVQQRLGDDADRVGEVDDPRARGEFGDPLGDLQNDRHGSQCLAQPSDAGRLLPDAPALQRKRLVAVPGPLASDTQLK